ncbi:Plasmodium exported protein, unknown function [Plasmodium vivax]|uniref:Uncharacterized protein n=1 Tax=Plasmodium vivax TaxID=5855 RepID=A0A565A5G5_PLAVI|nr:Plasmodium exported protein, unknown function [Plasmodium vivax]
MINFHIFIKIVTFISLTWMYICNNDVFFFIKILEKERQQYGTIDMRHFRLLAIKNGIKKKIFDKLDGIRLLAKNMKDDKKCFTKVLKRYGIPFCLSAIFVFAVGIINILNICRVKCFYSVTKMQDTLFHVGYSILLDILPITIFLVLSYIMIKVLKYDRLVEGKVEGKKIAKKISCYYDDGFNST